MSMDYYEYEQQAAEEAYIDSIINEAREDIISEFQDERLSSFYDSHKGLEDPALEFLERAKALSMIDATASFVMAYSASEYFIKKVLLEPIIVGFIHDENVDEIIAPIVMKDRGFLGLLFLILEKYGVNISEEEFAGTGRTIKQEWYRQKKLRNDAVHRCQKISTEDAQLAISLATKLSTDVFVSLLTALGISYDK